ncbi:beta-lactamase superfamily domain-containing protein [Dactylonectria macrodidyma]|uniref:Beta-lactamase superfamily domain-containing protein n=1 Tax=Dactylonectria macrodidyma TaxID=307937 RepID=A0A9P9FSE4_9HYPO|nr:beta-lactamase superfamily domain-containing protein [Dactylonectria macrodidyma]
MPNHVSITPRPRPPVLEPPAHWVGNPPTRFRNPWPSFRAEHSLVSMWRVRFGSDRNFVPVPEDQSELVSIQKPDWGVGKQCAKTVWIGHASFFIEMTPVEGQKRGIRLLLDPVFCERMGPTSFTGPKRFLNPPCQVEDVPEVDIICISHNHYDHLDLHTVKKLYFDKRRAEPLRFICGLGSKKWFLACGFREEHITEVDWWDELDVEVKDVGSLKLVCTPSQHGSRRGAFDDCHMLWCSFVIEEQGLELNRKIYFAGDTGYRSVMEEDMASGKDLAELPSCPAFAEIGAKYGPFDLALLPIGCYTPRSFMSSVHCSPEDSVEIHRDIKSKRSLGMHYGTVRGGLSAQYEDVREPPKRWKEACESNGLRWNQDIFLCDIGETVLIE